MSTSTSSPTDSSIPRAVTPEPSFTNICPPTPHHRLRRYETGNPVTDSIDGFKACVRLQRTINNVANLVPESEISASARRRSTPQPLTGLPARSQAGSSAPLSSQPSSSPTNPFVVRNLVPQLDTSSANPFGYGEVTPQPSVSLARMSPTQDLEPSFSLERERPAEGTPKEAVDENEAMMMETIFALAGMTLSGERNSLVDEADIGSGLGDDERRQKRIIEIQRRLRGAHPEDIARLHLIARKKEKKLLKLEFLMRLMEEDRNLAVSVEQIQKVRKRVYRIYKPRIDKANAEYRLLEKTLREEQERLFP